LRAEVKKIEGLNGAGGGAGFMPLGMAEVDARIRGGGLAVRALHEVRRRAPDVADDAGRDPVPGGAGGRRNRATRGAQASGAVGAGPRDLFAPAWPGRPHPDRCSTPNAAMTRKCSR
jgi:hypothetical protein